jgi:hypothetical protein
MNDIIRPYGPGKFSTILDSYVYSVSLDGGCDEEEGSVSESGAWYGIMRNGRTIFRDHDPMLETLNAAEQEKLTSSAGVILYEDSNGFVYVSYYATDDELNAEWAKVVAEFAEPEEEDENRVSCDQCQMLSINGVPCHETGCPNINARFDSNTGQWTKQRKCFDCGCTVDANDPCCSVPMEEEEN